MDTLTQYTLAAAGNQDSGGLVLLGAGAQVYGSVAASKTLGLGDGVVIDGDACGRYINSAERELLNISGRYGDCEHMSTLHQEINHLSDSLAVEGVQKGDLQGGGVLTPGVYHIHDLILGAQDSLVLRGEPGQRLVVNVHGNAQMDAGAQVVLTGGLQAQDVFFNFINESRYNSFEFGGATLVGTYVSNGRTFIMGDGATLQNARFYTTGDIIADVEVIRFDESPPIPFIQAVPDVLDTQSVVAVSTPSTPLLFLLFCIAAWLMRRKS